MLDCPFICLQQSYGQVQQIKFDTLYCDKTMKPESGQYPTTQTKIVFNCQLMTVVPAKWLCHVMVNFIQLAKNRKISRKQLEKVNQLNI